MLPQIGGIRNLINKLERLTNRSCLSRGRRDQVLSLISLEELLWYYTSKP